MTHSTDPWRPVAWCSEARDAALGYFGTAIEDIERILRVDSPDEQVREDLAWSLYAYVRDRAGDSGYSGEGSPAQIRNRVEAIRKAARSLRAALAPTDAAVDTVTVTLMDGDVDVVLLNEQVDATIAVLKKVKTDRGGNRPLADPEHWLLIDRVTDIFERTTQRRAALSEHRGKRSFSGDFFRIAELVEAAAAAATKRRPATNSALGSRLRRLLKFRAEPSAIF